MKNLLSSFPFRLLAFLILPILVLLMLISFGGVALHQEAMRDLLVEHNQQAVRGTAVTLSEQLKQRREILMALAANIENGQDVQTTLENARPWLDVFFDGGIAFYRNGELLTASSQSADWEAFPNPAHLSVYSYVIEPGHNQTQIIIRTSAISVRDPNSVIQVVGAVSLERLGIAAVLESLHSPGGAASYLTGDGGQILYHSNPALVGKYADQIPASKKDAVVTSAPVEAPDWTLVQDENWHEAISPFMRYSQATPLILVPGLLLALVVVWFGVRRIVRPLQQLEAQANELGWGNFSAIEKPVGGIEEIQHLQDALRLMVKNVQTVQSGMHNYIGAITRAQEDERTRLARELHDETTQSLVALNHRQQLLKVHLRDNPDAAVLLTELRSMIEAIIEDLRRIVRAMRPIYLEELGLATALKMLVKDLNLGDQVVVRFEQKGEPCRLSPERELALYRVAQEALSNAWHHSQATSMALSIAFEESHVTVSVSDNGKGFASPQRATDLSGTGHFGIMGMYERAALVGAHLHISSERSKGTTVTIRIPLTETN